MAFALGKSYCYSYTISFTSGHSVCTTTQGWLLTSDNPDLTVRQFLICRGESIKILLASFGVKRAWQSTELFGRLDVLSFWRLCI